MADRLLLEMASTVYEREFGEAAMAIGVRSSRSGGRLEGGILIAKNEHYVVQKDKVAKLENDAFSKIFCMVLVPRIHSKEEF